MILLAPKRAMGGIQTWAAAVMQAWPNDVVLLDTSPPRRKPSQDLSPLLAIVGLFSGVKVWMSAIRRARRTHEAIWATTAPSIGYRVRDVPFVLLSRSLGVRVVVHVHGSLMTGLLGEGQLSRRWALLGLRRASAVVVLDAQTQRHLSKLTGRRIDRLPNFTSPADSDATRSAPAKAILYVGRVSLEKGSEVLLELGRRLPEGSLLTVVGPLAPEIDETFRREAAQGLLVVTDRLSPAEVKAKLAEADVLVLPSDHEGFPMVVLEAMACGLPVVASDVGACHEMLVEGPLPPAGAVLESPERLGRAIFVEQLLGLLADAPRLQGFVGGPERVSTHYSAGAVIPRMQAVLEGTP